MYLKMKRTILQGLLVLLSVSTTLRAEDPTPAATPTTEATPASSPVATPTPTSVPVATDLSVIGKSADDLRALAGSGNEIKSEPAWCGGTAYGFIVGDRFIYAIVGDDGKVGDVFFAAINPSRKITKEEAAQLLTQNGAVSKARFIPSGYGAGEKKIAHFVVLSTDGKSGLVGNYGPINKPEEKRLGFQIRTLEQFNAEQKTIQKLTAQAIADWKKAHPRKNH